MRLESTRENLKLSGSCDCDGFVQNLVVWTRDIFIEKIENSFVLICVRIWYSYFQMSVDSTSRKVLITGASGVLGRSVSRRFVQSGWKILGLEIKKSFCLSVNEIFFRSRVEPRERRKFDSMWSVKLCRGRSGRWKISSKNLELRKKTHFLSFSIQSPTRSFIVLQKENPTVLKKTRKNRCFSTLKWQRIWLKFLVRFCRANFVEQ